MISVEFGAHKSIFMLPALDGIRLSKNSLRKIEEPVSERLDDAQRPGGGLGGGRLKGGVK